MKVKFSSLFKLYGSPNVRILLHTHTHTHTEKIYNIYTIGLRA